MTTRRCHNLRARSFRPALDRLEARQLMANWYVATTGVDTNAGSIDKPFASISRAAATAKPGDTVFVRGGTYSPTRQQFIGSNGTAAARIAFKPFGTEKVVLNGSSLATVTDLVSIMGSYVDFGGFEVKNSRNIGIVVVNASAVRVHNNVVHDNFNLGIASWSKNQTDFSGLVIEGNTVYLNAKGKFPGDDNKTGSTQGIGVTAGRNATIRGNTVYQNWGQGIGVNRVNGAVVEENTVSDNYGVNIYLWDQTGCTVQRNFIYSIGDKRFYRYAMPAPGVQIGTETTLVQSSRNNVISNNITYGVRCGFYYGNYAVGGGLLNTVVANNTFVDSWQGGIWIDNGPHAGSRVVNNIIQQKANTKSLAFYTTNSGVTFSNNCWFGVGTTPASVKGAGDIYADPMLLRAGSLNPADYQLQSTSPLRNRGLLQTQTKTDFGKRTRGTSYDIGAWEIV
jgi:parallel beta-helix repeat protein